MIPVQTRVREVDLVYEGLAGGNRVLGDSRHAVETVFEADAVPVDRGREVDRVREADHDARMLGDAQQRSGVLAVEAVHDEDAATDLALHDARFEGDGVAVSDVQHLARGRPGQGCRVDAFPGEERVHRGADAAEAGQHGVADHRHDHVTGAADRIHRRHHHVHARGPGGVLGHGPGVGCPDEVCPDRGRAGGDRPGREYEGGRCAGREECVARGVPQRGPSRYLDHGGTTPFMRAYAISWPRCSFMCVMSWSSTAQPATSRP